MKSNLDIIAGGSQNTTPIDGTVDTYADLPLVASSYGKIYGTREASGPRLGLLGLTGPYKYPAGASYIGDAETNNWELSPYNVIYSEDTTTVVTIVD